MLSSNSSSGACSMLMAHVKIIHLNVHQKQNLCGNGLRAYFIFAMNRKCDTNKNKKKMQKIREKSLNKICTDRVSNTFSFFYKQSNVWYKMWIKFTHIIHSNDEIKLCKSCSFVFFIEKWGFLFSIFIFPNEKICLILRLWMKRQMSMSVGFIFFSVIFIFHSIACVSSCSHFRSRFHSHFHVPFICRT